MRHVPALLNEVVDNLQLKSGMQVVDCTLGDGGHAAKILEKIGPKGKLLGIDADPESLLRSKQYLYKWQEQVIGVRDNFINLKKIVVENHFGPVDAILMDLGWSSPQFRERGRGFSFLADEPLDMRFGGQQDKNSSTAADVVNSYSEEALAKLFRTYGEENLYNEIARAIVAARERHPIERSGELSDIILQSYRAKLRTDAPVPWIGGLHPATKVFQALRIEVNHELEVLRQALPQAVALLAQGGRLAVIAFHSLEDRIVKQYFKSINNKIIKLVNNKPIVASAEEVAENARAKSAKLRVVEKI
ncbi:MAG: 16S rRNA (cytosine(1402)-N(4))-methyltransferase RsmH [Candidatus Magasanikbacteria bacterium]|nr:16S rRNA (cytosine(1402)-N(4))-methyltransferase RsmH [Candidatus Magasanikbacteria bacterium]